MPPRALRDRSAFGCVECGCTVPKWVGRCPECHAWGSVQSLTEVSRPLRGVTAGPVSRPALPIGEVDADAARAAATGLGELDRVLGGGLIPGGVVLLAGEPGVGKSTLLLAVASRWAHTGRRVLVVTAEESVAQVRLRAERTGAVAPRLFVAAETDLSAVLGQLDAVAPELLVVDSVQTIAAAGVEGTAGGPAQVRAVAAALIAAAKERDIATILVGHVTKDGAVAGPRLLEHLVDVVLQFEGDRHSALRLLRASKNRFGPADEVGCFELTDEGLTDLPDPSGFFLTRHAAPVPGTCVTVTLEGRRPLLAEVQALVTKPAGEFPRRACAGLDQSRVSMVLAVLERRGRVPMGRADVFAATGGGVRVSEPAADLALALALAGAVDDRPLPTGVVAIGELGLAGDVRPVSGLGRRLAEAARLGFRVALVPPDSGAAPAGITVREVVDLPQALRLSGRPASLH